MSQLTVVFFSMQSRANTETFDEKQFLDEVTLPIRGLLAPPSVADKFLIVTLSSVKYEHGETFTRHLISEDGPPPHLFSPTSDAVREHLRGPVREGKVAFLNIEHLNEESSIEFATNFAFASGTNHVLVLRHGMRLPTRGGLRFLYEKMLMDKRRSVLCQCPEHIAAPA